MARSVDDRGSLLSLLRVVSPEPLKNVRHLGEGTFQVGEVGEPVLVDREPFFRIVDSDPNRFREFEVVGQFDVDDGFERDANLEGKEGNEVTVFGQRDKDCGSHLDTLAFILAPEDDFLDDLDPLIPTYFVVGSKVPRLFGRVNLEAIWILDG